MKPLKSFLSRFWPVPVIILAWEALYRMNLFHPLVFPSVFDIFQTIFEDSFTGEIPAAILRSLLIIFLSFIPAIVLAFTLTAMSRGSGYMNKMIIMLSDIVHPLPGIALLPILILWTGLGMQVIVIIVVHSVLWPLLINLMKGMDETPEAWIRLGYNNELSPTEMFLTIYLPGAYPYLLAGLKIGWARSWRAVISAEMIFGTISGSGGLGWYIFNQRIFMDSPGMYAGILVLMILGVFMEKAVFAPLEKQSARRRGGVV